jgi:hypothetical protein
MEVTMQDSIVMKLWRHDRGVLVNVKLDPSIEAFFRRWGGDIKEPVTYHGPIWTPVKPKIDPSLEVWNYNPTSDDEPPPYSLYRAGYPLIENGQANISFLRLVGAGTPDGVSFVCDMVVSRPELERTANKLIRASELFYQEYIQPVGLRLSVKTEELRKFDDN